MYENAKSTVNINGTIGDPFPVKVGAHQGSVELLYADDLVLMAYSIE